MYYKAFEFDKNIIIPDPVFFDTGTVKEENIQKLFESKKSTLATYKINGRRAATVIHESALKYGLNPAVMVARLQTENSAITDPLTPDEIDWILGVGCPDKRTRKTEFKGIDKQVEAAAYKLGRQYLYEKPFLNGGGLPAKMIVENHAGDGEKWVIQPKSKAAYVLYTYNPEIGAPKFAGDEPTGNYLFYLVFKRYFCTK